MITQTQASGSTDGCDVLMLGLHSAANCGDEALASVAISALRAGMPGCRITLSANDPDSYRGHADTVVGSFVSGLGRAGGIGGAARRMATLLWLPVALLIASVSRAILGRVWVPLAYAHHRDLLRALSEARVVFGCPGGYLYRRHKAGAFIGVVFPFVVACLWRKPLHLLPQSIGPCPDGWQRRVLKWVMGHCRQIAVRERHSEEFVRTLLGDGHPAVLRVPDMAFAFEGASVDEGRATLRGMGVDIREGALAIGLTMIQHKAQTGNADVQQHYEHAIATALRAFGAQSKRHVHVVLLPQCTGPNPGEDDRVVQNRFASAFPSSRNITVSSIAAALPARVVWSCISCMDLMVSTRMHAGIFALAQGIPVIAISYLPKTPGIMAEAGMAAWVLDGASMESAVLREMLVRAEASDYVFSREGRAAVSAMKADLRSRIGPMIEVAAMACAD